MSTEIYENVCSSWRRLAKDEMPQEGDEFFVPHHPKYGWQPSTNHVYGNPQAEGFVYRRRIELAGQTN